MILETLKKLYKQRRWENLAVIFTMVGFAAVKFFSVSFRYSDGNIYLYMADAISKGILPYRDFFWPILLFSFCF